MKLYGLKFIEDDSLVKLDVDIVDVPYTLNDKENEYTLSSYGDVLFVNEDRKVLEKIISDDYSNTNQIGKWNYLPKVQEKLIGNLEIIEFDLNL